MAKIEAIIFDCFGVLATDTWLAFIESLPAEADIERAREAHRAYDAGLLSKDECAAEIGQATGKQFVELEDVKPGSIAKNMQLLQYIRDLHEQGYKIGVLSNASSNWIRESFFDPDEAAIFDDYVLSYEVGMIKPEPRMFLLATERLHTSLEHTVLVDDKEDYCTAAREEGLQAIWYKGFQQFRTELEQLLSA